MIRNVVVYSLVILFCMMNGYCIAEGCKYKSVWGILLACMAILGSVVVLFIWHKLQQIKAQERWEKQSIQQE